MYTFTLLATKETAPYRILANTFGVHNELCLSGGHAFKDKKGLWQFPMLSKNPNIQQYGIGERVTYYHIECPNYFTDNLIAEGLVVESFRNGQSPHRHVYIWNKQAEGFIRKQESSLIPTDNEGVYNDYNILYIEQNDPTHEIHEIIEDTRATHVPAIKFHKYIEIASGQFSVKPEIPYAIPTLEDTRVLPVPATKLHNYIDIASGQFSVEPETLYTIPTLEDTRVVPVPAGKLQPNIELQSRIVARIKKVKKASDGSQPNSKKKATPKPKVKEVTFFKF